MEILIVNAIVYTLTLAYCYKRNRLYNVAGYLLTIYAVCAWFSCFFYIHPSFVSSVHGSVMTWEPFFYLYLAIIISFQPIMNFKDQNVVEILTPNLKIFILACYCLACGSIIYIAIYLPYAVETLFTSSIYYSRFDALELGESRFLILNNVIFSIYVRIFSSFTDIGLLFSFYGFIFLKKYKTLMLTLLILMIISNWCYALAQTSRALPIFQIIQLGFLYVLFYRYIDKKLKKKINILSLIVITIGIIVVFAITVGRFSYHRYFDMYYFLLKYPGESFINFNGLLYNNINSIDYGYTQFPFFRRILGLDYGKTILDNQAYWAYYIKITPGIFYQFVGSLYVAFGKFGTLIILLLISVVGKRTIKSSPLLNFRTLILLSLLFNIYSRGVFFFSFGNEPGNMSIIVHIILYLMFKYFPGDMNESYCEHGSGKIVPYQVKQ